MADWSLLQAKCFSLTVNLWWCLWESSGVVYYCVFSLPHHKPHMGNNMWLTHDLSGVTQLPHVWTAIVTDTKYIYVMELLYLVSVSTDVT